MSIGQLIDQIVIDAIERRIFPGAVVAVAQGDTTLHQAAYGALTYDGAAQPVAHDTIYDVASLTKMFTATAALHLLDQGAIDLETPVHMVLPRFRSPEVTLFHLLTHTSGLDIRLSTMRMLRPDSLLAAVYATKPQRPGSQVAYTNVNALLLGEIVCALTSTTLDAALNELIVRPLGLRDTFFCPPEGLRERIAPTEIDSEWRGRLVHGSVHDESAHALGGIAGHAGLFATAADLLTFCQMWQHARTQPMLLSPPTAQRATTNQTAALNAACGLGWMIDRPNFMGRAPTGSFGHTGFTGPAMICIPGRNISIVILSNRVHPHRGPATHHAVTAAIVEAVLASVSVSSRVA